MEKNKKMVKLNLGKKWWTRAIIVAISAALGAAFIPIAAPAAAGAGALGGFILIELFLKGQIEL